MNGLGKNFGFNITPKGIFAIRGILMKLLHKIDFFHVTNDFLPLAELFIGVCCFSYRRFEIYGPGIPLPLFFSSLSAVEPPGKNQSSSIKVHGRKKHVSSRGDRFFQANSVVS